MTIKSAHGRLLEQLIAARRAQLIDQFVSGACPDYASYRQCVGLIEGLDDALKLSDEADFKLNGDDIGDR